MLAVKKRRVVKIKKIPGPAKQLVNNISRAAARRKTAEAAAEAARAGKPVDARVSAWLSRQDALLADAVRAAEQRGFSVDQLRIEELKSNPALASQVAEQAVILAAAKAGIDIFKADGTIDR